MWRASLPSCWDKNSERERENLQNIPRRMPEMYVCSCSNLRFYVSSHCKKAERERESEREWSREINGEKLLEECFNSK